MSMKLLKNMIIDVFFFYLFYVTFFKLPYHDIAETIIRFFFWFQAIFGTFILIASDKVAELVAPKTSFKTRTKFHQGYAETTLLIEVCLLLAIGAWWLAIFYLAGSMGLGVLNEKVTEIRGDA